MLQSKPSPAVKRLLQIEKRAKALSAHFILFDDVLIEHVRFPEGDEGPVPFTNKDVIHNMKVLSEWVLTGRIRPNEG